MNRGKALNPKEFAERPVGKSGEPLLTAYAQYHLSQIASERCEKLRKQDAVPLARAQQHRAAYQVERVGRTKNDDLPGAAADR